MSRGADEQLREIAVELRGAEERLSRLRARLSEDRWSTPPEPGSWSVGECVAHLNLTAAPYLPIPDEGLPQALGADAPRRDRRDPVGWLLGRSVPPPVRFRFRTPSSFVPQGDRPLAELVEAFSRHQHRHLWQANGVAERLLAGDRPS